MSDMKAKHKTKVCGLFRLKTSTPRHVINGQRSAELPDCEGYTIDLLYSDVSLWLKVKKKSKSCLTSVFPLYDTHV